MNFKHTLNKLQPISYFAAKFKKTMKISIRNVGFALVALFSLLAFAQCSSDMLPEPMTPEICETVTVTYDDQIKDIIANSCAYGGACHPAIAPSFVDYDNVKQFESKIRSRVIDMKDDPINGMPPSSLVPNGQPLELSEEELNLFICWLDAGAPK